MVYGVRCIVHGAWCMVYGVWCMVYRLEMKDRQDLNFLAALGGKARVVKRSNTAVRHHARVQEEVGCLSSGQHWRNRLSELAALQSEWTCGLNPLEET